MENVTKESLKKTGAKITRILDILESVLSNDPKNEKTVIMFRSQAIIAINNIVRDEIGF